MSMKPAKQYLIVDTKKYRRHSAPGHLSTWFASHLHPSGASGRQHWSRASVSDFSVLLENQEESGSSLELDTSTLSRDLSPIPTTKSSLRGSYQHLVIDIEEHRRNNEGDSLWNGLWFIWKNILISQALAGCLAVMDVSNRSLKQNSQHLLTNGQNLPHYIILGVVWTAKLAMRNDGRDIVEIIKYSGLRYLFLSVLHVEANYLLCSSFHHYTYLGNQMIDCVAASLSLVIAYVCLEVQFHFVHISGFVFTIVGGIGLCAANILNDNPQNQGNVLLGDVLRMASGICLALNSIAQEIIITSIDFDEYMGMIGLIGSLVCGFQVMTLETNKTLPKSSGYWSCVLSYSASQFLFNSLTPVVLRDMGATGLHLALTSSAFYSYFIAAISQQVKVELLYLISFVVATVGSILFTLKKTSIGTKNFFPVKVILLKGS